MRHLSPANSGPRLCQLCELVASRRYVHSAKRPFVTLHASRRLPAPPREIPIWPFATRLFTTSKPCLKVKRVQAVQPSGRPGHPQSRFDRGAKASNTQPEDTSRGGQAAQLTTNQHDVVDLSEISGAVDRITKAFLAQPGIPSEQTTLTALRACGKGDFRVSSEVSEQQSEHSEPETTASHLLDLDSTQTIRKAAATESPQPRDTVSRQDVVDRISNAAYAIITHPPVVITPQVLTEYVGLQSRLGKPESLPQVLELFASKPTPELASGSVWYKERSSRGFGTTIDTAVAEKAVEAAIEAKNLDAAVGIVESTYATKASRRQRLLSKALVPATAFTLTPIAVYILASDLSVLPQNSLDQGTATTVTFAAISAYVGFTAIIGGVAASTANDQMMRVTWAPGTPLRERWLREAERAAYDKVACGFGFSDPRRHGEEQGEEFQLLREFLLRRGMVLDAVELMAGMN
ncbi:hypothetical protein OQA88_1518 [Cercophora sp. LCS_1]